MSVLSYPLRVLSPTEGWDAVVKKGMLWQMRGEAYPFGEWAASKNTHSKILRRLLGCSQSLIKKQCIRNPLERYSLTNEEISFQGAVLLLFGGAAS
jgi:hypothetical protein